MFSISRARLALPVQFLFLVVNGLGVILGTVYNLNTPDLYENNAHHTFGWVVTWIMTAQVAMMLIFIYSGRFTKTGPTLFRAEDASLTAENMKEHNMRPFSDYRWSEDSGQSTEQSSTLNSCDISLDDPNREKLPKDRPKPEEEASICDADEDAEEVPLNELLPPSTKKRFPLSAVVDRYLTTRIPDLLTERSFKALEVAYELIDRTSLILGFVAILSGGITWSGLFVSPDAVDVVEDHF